MGYYLHDGIILLAEIKMKNRLIKEIFFSVLTAFLTVVLFLLTGSFYVANDHSVMLNIIVWILLVMASYTIIYLFSLIKHKYSYYDGYAIMSGFLVVLIICLFKTKEGTSYLYVDSFVLFSSIIPVPQLLIDITSNIKNRDYVINQKLLGLKGYTKIELIHLSKIVNTFYNKDDFTKLDVIDELQISSYYCEKYLKIGIKEKIIIRNKTNNKYLYSIVK